jgi:hypothetical protein
VKGKASNENTKVSEVIFINTLNAEDVADQLQRRLAEVEARILAASQRRKERLADIAIERQQRNSRKTQQMSALRLSMEKQQMERWNKLQSRLEAVQKRREARFVELQRRNAALQGQNNSPYVSTPEYNHSNITSAAATATGSTKMANKALPRELTFKNPMVNTESKKASSASSSKQMKHRHVDSKDDEDDEIFKQFARDIHNDEIVELRKYLSTKAYELFNDSATTITSTMILREDMLRSSYAAVMTNITKRVALAAKQQLVEYSNTLSNEAGFCWDSVDDLKAIAELKRQEGNLWSTSASDLLQSAMNHVKGASTSSQLKFQIVSLMIDSDAGLLQNTSSFCTAIRHPTWKASASNPLLCLYHIFQPYLLDREYSISHLCGYVSRATGSEHTSKPAIGEVSHIEVLLSEVYSSRIGTSLIDLLHVYLNLSTQLFFSAPSPSSSTDELESILTQSKAWLQWNVDIGRDLYLIASILHLIMLSTSSSLIRQSQGTLRWYLVSSGVLAKLPSVFQLLQSSLSSIQFMTAAILEPLQLSSTIRSTNIPSTSTSTTSNSVTKSSRAVKMKSVKSSKSHFTKKQVNMLKEYNHEYLPWKVLFGSTQLILSSIYSLKPLEAENMNDSVLKKVYHTKEIISLVRINEILPSSLHLTSALFAEYVKYVSRSTSLSIFTSQEKNKQKYNLNYLQELSYQDTKHHQPQQSNIFHDHNYSMKLFQIVSYQIKNLLELCDLDSSLYQNLAKESMTLLIFLIGNYFLMILKLLSTFQPEVLPKGNNSPHNTSTPSRIRPSSGASSSNSSLYIELEYMIGKLLVFIGRISLRRSDIQSLLSSTYETLYQRSMNLSSTSSTASSTDIPMLYQHLLEQNTQKNRSLLRDLCTLLPGKYFNDEQYKHYLLPTLISMTLDSDGSLIQLRSMMTISILTTYLQKLLRELEENQRVSDSSTTAVAMTRDENRGHVNIVEHISKRLPSELWTLALEIYSTVLQGQNVLNEESIALESI